MIKCNIICNSFLVCQIYHNKLSLTSPDKFYFKLDIHSLIHSTKLCFHSYGYILCVVLIHNTMKLENQLNSNYCEHFGNHIYTHVNEILKFTAVRIIKGKH